MARRFVAVALGSVVFGAFGLGACGGDDGGGSAAEFCSLKTEFDALGGSFDRIDSGLEGLGAGDATAAKAAFGELYTALDQADALIDDARDKAPGEIADDFDVIADAFGAVVDTLPAQDDVNAAIDANDLAALQTLFAEFGTAAAELGSGTDVDLASDNLEAYTTANCEAAGAGATAPASTAPAAAGDGNDSAG